MKFLILVCLCLFTPQIFSQESSNEFLDVIVEGREAFMSTKTGEVIFREHAKTNPEFFITDSDGNTLYVETTIHNVKKEETIYSISKKYKVSEEKVKSDNKLSNVNLAVGQSLKIIKLSSVESLKATVSSVGESRIVARLAPGQNPTQLNSPPPTGAPSSTYVKANDVVKEVNEVKEITEEKSNVILNESEESQQNNSTISSKETTNLYTVKKGDTLFGIAKKHGITVQELKKLNDLVLTNISIGQKLKIK